MALDNGDDQALRGPNDEWLQRWHDNNIGWHHEEYNPHLLGFWPQVEAPPGARVLVPLCGKSRDMVWLAEHGHSIVGVELSPLAVEAFFKEQGRVPAREQVGCFERWRAAPYELLCGDIFDLDRDVLGEVAAGYDRASLVALNPDQRRSYASLLARLLPPGARTLLVAMEYPQGEMPGPPYSVEQREVESLFSAGFSIRLLHSLDLLKETRRYADRGLEYMLEKVYLLQRL